MTSDANESERATEEESDMALEVETSTPAESSIALKEIISAMVFAAKEPLGVRDIRKIIAEVADENEGALFGDVKEKQIKVSLAELEQDLENSPHGMRLIEFADGFAFQTDPNCGPWLRKLLKIEPRRRLSKPALETLAIIAYRQPIVRSEIEGVRGVSVDHIIRTLLELQLIRIVGRSELPGRPLMYGTTQHFLDHFGLKAIEDLPGIEQLSRAEADRIRGEEEARKTELRAAELAAETDPTENGAEAPAEADAASAEAGEVPEGDAAPEGGSAPDACADDTADETAEDVDEGDEDEYDDDDD